METGVDDEIGRRRKRGRGRCRLRRRRLRGRWGVGRGVCFFLVGGEVG